MRSGRLSAGRIVAIAVGALLIVGGLLLVPTVVTVSNRPPVTAVRVQATVLEDTTTPPETQCDGIATGMPVQFDWNGSPIAEKYYPPCGHHYAKGATLSVYAASDDPSDLADAPAAITDPSTEDPFAVFGPNDQGILLGFLTLCLFVSGAGLVLAGILAKPKDTSLPAVGTLFLPPAQPAPAPGPDTPLFPGRK